MDKKTTEQVIRQLMIANAKSDEVLQNLKGVHDETHARVVEIATRLSLLARASTKIGLDSIAFGITRQVTELLLLLGPKDAIQAMKDVETLFKIVMAEAPK